MPLPPRHRAALRLILLLLASCPGTEPETPKKKGRAQIEDTTPVPVGAVAGGSCSAEGLAQCEQAAVLLCRSGTWTRVPCRGPDGCVVEDAPRCDDSLGEEGEPCVLSGQHSCGTDKRRALVCDGGKFRRYMSCRGPKGCTMSSGSVTCDSAPQGSVGDPCDSPGQKTCSLDKKSELECQNGTFVKRRDCKSCTTKCL